MKRGNSQSHESSKRVKGEQLSSASCHDSGEACRSEDGGYPADWPCMQCNEINFARRQACRKCLAPRESESGGGGNGGSQDSFFKTGDWNCVCGEHNFASRSTCRKCNASKNASSGNLSSRGGESVDSNFKNGDWMCPKCNDHNFATRSVCRQCSTNKPLEGAAGRWGNTSGGGTFVTHGTGGAFTSTSIGGGFNNLLYA